MREYASIMIILALVFFTAMHLSAQQSDINDNSPVVNFGVAHMTNDDL